MIFLSIHVQPSLVISALIRAHLSERNYEVHIYELSDLTSKKTSYSTMTHPIPPPHLSTPSQPTSATPLIAPSTTPRRIKTKPKE
jgi:hypothetical protein